MFLINTCVLSKTFNNYYCISFGCQVVGPICCGMHIKITQCTFWKENGYAPLCLVGSAAYCTTALCAMLRNLSHTSSSTISCRKILNVEAPWVSLSDRYGATIILLSREQFFKWQNFSIPGRCSNLSGLWEINAITAGAAGFGESVEALLWGWHLDWDDWRKPSWKVCWTLLCPTFILRK